MTHVLDEEELRRLAERNARAYALVWRAYFDAGFELAQSAVVTGAAYAVAAALMSCPLYWAVRVMDLTKRIRVLEAHSNIRAVNGASYL